MTWTLYDVTKGTNFPIHNDGKIALTLHELDNASVSIVGAVDVDDYVYIVESQTASTIFRGYIKNIDEQDVTKIKKLTLIETGNELKDHIVVNGTSRSFILSSTTVQAVVDVILTGTAWTRGTTDITAVASIAFSNINSIEALNKLLYQMYGYEIWFIDTGTSKTVYWGTVRTVKGAVTYRKKVQTNDSNNRNITDVTVFGNDDSIYGSYSTGTTPKKERLFRNRTCKAASECTKIATTLVNDYRNPRNRYTLYLMPVYSYNPCDQITVDGTDYIIRDVTYTPSECQLGIGSYLLSYTDTMGGDLEEVKGSVTQGTDAQWSGGTQNVSGDGSTQSIFTLDIKDINQIGANFDLRVNIGTYKKTSTASTTSDLLSDISQVISNTTYTTTTYFSSGYNYLTSVDSIVNDGSQFGMATFIADILSNGTNQITIYCQYSDNASTWTTSSVVYNAYLQDAVKTPVSFSVLIPGSTSVHHYVRFAVYAYGASQIRVYNAAYMYYQRVTRHRHSIPAQTDELAIVGSAPSSVTVVVNSTSLGTKADNTVTNIKSSLVTGKNTIYVTSSAKGSVSLAANYQTLGKS